jgi:hypothetical protein
METSNVSATSPCKLSLLVVQGRRRRKTVELSRNLRAIVAVASREHQDLGADDDHGRVLDLNVGLRSCEVGEGAADDPMLCRGGGPPASVPRRDARCGLWHYVAVAPKQSKLAMVTARSGRDNRSVALQEQGGSRTVSTAGPHWAPSRSDPALPG